MLVEPEEEKTAQICSTPYLFMGIVLFGKKIEYPITQSINSPEIGEPWVTMNPYGLLPSSDPIPV